MKALQNLEHYIENEPWEEYVENGAKWLNWFSWGMIIFAVIYFGGVFLKMFLEGKL